MSQFTARVPSHARIWRAFDENAQARIYLK
jgi:hypothetical protein